MKPPELPIWSPENQDFTLGFLFFIRILPILTHFNAFLSRNRLAVTNSKDLTI